MHILLKCAPFFMTFSDQDPAFSSSPGRLIAVGENRLFKRRERRSHTANMASSVASKVGCQRFSSVFLDGAKITGDSPATLTARAACTVWGNAALLLFVRETSKFLLIFPTVSELQIVGIALTIGRTVDIGRAPTFIEFVHSR